MDFDKLVTILLFLFVISLFGGLFWTKNYQTQIKTEAIQKLVEQGTPALEAACAIKGK